MSPRVAICSRYFRAFPKFVGGFHATRSPHIARLALNAEPSRTAIADGRRSGHKRLCRPAHYETAWRPAAQARNAAARRISQNCASDNRSAPPRSDRSWKRRLHADLASPLMNNCRPVVTVAACCATCASRDRLIGTTFPFVCASKSLAALCGRIRGRSTKNRPAAGLCGLSLEPMYYQCCFR